jgi:hemerythrin-like domain-containing protein
MTTHTNPLQRLSTEHQYCLVLADQLAQIAAEGSDVEVLAGIRLAQDYNVEEMETHLQHEEHTIIGPLLQGHPEHASLCIQLAQEHGQLRTLAAGFNPATARDDLAQFASLLRQHTLMEEQQLFPLLADLLTPVQWEAMLNFTPLYQLKAST